MLVNTGISYPLLFRAMRSLNGAVRQIAGYDEWRRLTEDRRLREINHTLAREIPFAPSKRTGNPNSVWAKVHFQMMLTGLRMLPQHPAWKHLEKTLLTASQTRHYFKFVDDVMAHLQCYEQARLCSLALQEKLVKHEGGLVTLLDSHAGKYAASDLGQFLKGVVSYLHNGTTDIPMEEWQRMEHDAPPRVSLVGGLLCLLLPSFPASPDDLSVEHKRLLGAASQNNLLGRIIQSFYADERGIPYAEMGINASAEEYFGESLHTRLLHYMDELANCPLSIRTLSETPSVPLSEILMLYCSWYQKPQVVEMISSDFSGAGEDASLRLEEIFTSLRDYEEMKELYYLWLPETGWNELAQDEYLCLRMGRLASVMDAIGNTPSTFHPMSGKVLYEMAAIIWNEEVRERTWGSHCIYLAGVHQASGMAEDIITLLQALLCNFRDHRLMLGNAYANPHLEILNRHIQKLSETTFSDADLLTYFREHHKDFSAIRNVAQKIAAMDKNSAASADAISYILRYFGIEPIEPLALPVHKLFARLPVLHVDTENGVFSAVYQEYGQETHISFPIPQGHVPAEVRYLHTRVVEEGLIYPACFSLVHEKGEVLLPIPGRQGYDPMGVTGTPHHAEVIGFGCSYHHHVLQSLLVCMAVWGADDATLQAAQEKMMAIHPENHKRHPLAQWQLAQTIAAFRHGERLTYASWINNALQSGHLRLSYGHNHTAKYLRYVESGQKNHMGELRLPKEYYMRMAWLHAVYPELYPMEQNKALLVDSDAAWYDETPPSHPEQTAFQKPSNLIRKVFA